ncbi:hypothetical protein [Pseudomonas rhodesiae]|uniref:hypothetical protein n=1 Tax=Pseudomonas rhodesiae TaxID=76760 RepID=UPI00289DA082|nr:hypothetical protein [Pseudomonas rhodesiae]
MPEIKERPILFSAPMVRAILEGRKTVTRREVKKQAALDCLAAGFEPAFLALPGNADLCPYGKPGDRLWVRETWYCDHSEVQKGPYLQPADMQDLDQAREDGDLVYAADGLNPYEQDQPTWRPSIHMPRWASRILLEITDVRVERLQDITEDQVQAEGCFFTDYGRRCGHGVKGWSEVGACPAPEARHPQRNGWMLDRNTSHEQCLDSNRNAFGNLWQSVGGDWSANPWVWVVEFKRVTS